MKTVGKLALLMLGLALFGVVRCEAQPRVRRVDFTDDRQKIPDSELFSEADYTESGVGLRFGIDKRLSYSSGQYEEAVVRFEEAVGSYRYKAEIWVFLARSYFYQKDPHQARRTIERAAAIMPDMAQHFWNPLLDSLLGEIRNRALNLQVQIDFYSKTPGDFLTLFRLYLFLQDGVGAAGVIGNAEGKAAKMALLATMVSGESRKRYNDESSKWLDLAGQLRGEIVQAGYLAPAVPPPSVAPAKDPELVERTRFLQTKVDFYQSQIEDYRELFENYLLLDMPKGARGVIGALTREAQRVKFLAATATDFLQESKYLDEVDAFDQLEKEFAQRIGDQGQASP